MKLWWAGFITLGLVLWSTSGGSPHSLRWAAILAMGGLLTVPLALTVKWITWKLLPLAVLLAWISGSLIWSADPAHGTTQLLKIVALFIIFLGIAQYQQALPYVISFSFLCLLVMQLTHPEQAGGFGNKNWAAEALMIMSPFVLYLGWKDRLGATSERPVLLSLLALVGLVWIIALSDSDSWLFVAWICGLALWITYGFKVVAFCWTIAPFSILGAFPNFTSAIWIAAWQRLELWINTAIMWWEAPLHGHGLGSFNYMYDYFREGHIAFWPELGTLLRPVTMSAGETHNELLQFAAQFGLVGIVLAALALWPLVFVRSSDPLVQVAKWSLLISGALCLISSPLQNPATALLVAMCLGVLWRAHLASESSALQLWALLGTRKFEAQGTFPWVK